MSGFTDPHEATAALREAPHHYDLLVTDYNMPGFVAWIWCARRA